jgi:hypothetical protein
MNQNQDQVYNSDKYPPSFNTIYSDSNNNNILTASSQQTANTLHVTYAAGVHPNTQSKSQIASAQTIFFHPTVFFYRPPNDFCHYYVSCKEISYDTVTCLLNKSLKENNVQYNENNCIFYYQQQHDTRFYQVSCEIVSPTLINNCLNENFLGIDFQNSEQEHLVFTINQKENLEFYLKQYLGLHLLS